MRSGTLVLSGPFDSTGINRGLCCPIYLQVPTTRDITMQARVGNKRLALVH